MVLKGRVTAVQSASGHLDGLQRVCISAASEKEFWSLVNLKNSLGLVIDQEVEVTVALPEAGAGREKNATEPRITLDKA